ncbi:MAG TPA: hypothetical protein VE988_13455 [Gemmataceae bacterium]|nr:hypothetical protein [Gemmataceae bacterium]
MKWSTFVVTAALTVGLLAGAVGCKENAVTVVGDGGKKLTVKPVGAASLKPGETTSINIEIVRDKFNDPVELKFSGLPDGITVVESDTTISKDASSAKLTLKASADAKPVDDHKVTLAASGGGMKLDMPFKVTIKKGGDAAKKLTLKAPADASVKQGDTATINIDITRDKFNDPVELKFAGLPEGVTIMEKDLTISKDATSAKLTLKAAADAKAVGDHKVTVTATGGGLTQEATIKVSVQKKS